MLLSEKLVKVKNYSNIRYINSKLDLSDSYLQAVQGGSRPILGRRVRQNLTR